MSDQRDSANGHVAVGHVLRDVSVLHAGHGKHRAKHRREGTTRVLRHRKPTARFILLAGLDVLAKYARVRVVDAIPTGDRLVDPVQRMCRTRDWTGTLTQEI